MSILKRIGVGRVLIGVGSFLVLFLLFRNCEQKVRIAALEGKLRVQQQILVTTTAEWSKAHKAWLEADAEARARIAKLQAEKDEAFGKIDSLQTHVTQLESSYDQLVATGAPCKALLINMTLQRDDWKNSYFTLKGQYDKLETDYNKLWKDYDLCKANDGAWAKRYSALEDVNKTLTAELKVSKRVNLGLVLQAKGLKVLTLAELAVGGYLLLRKS